MQFHPRYQKILICLLSSLASFFISALILRNGIGAWPDAWSFWEGSVSLIEKHSYSYLSGKHIAYWPPLFPLFLAVFQAVLSQTGQALAMAMSACSGLSTFVWSLYVFKIFEAEGKIESSTALVASLIFVPLFVPLSCTLLSSNSLELFFLGLLFYRIACLSDRQTAKLVFKDSIIIGLILCGAMLTHNSCIVFLAATMIVFFFAAGGFPKQRLWACGVIFFISFIPWISIRHLLGQGGSHQLAGGILPVLHYVKQSLYTVGVFFISTASVLVQSLVGFGILTLILCVFVICFRSVFFIRSRLCISLSLISFAGFFVLVNLTPLPNGLDGRYILYLPLAVMPPLFLWAKDRMMVMVFLIFLSTVVSGARITQRVWHGGTTPLTSQANEQSPKIIYCRYFLSANQEATVPQGFIRITPPVYPWGDHWMKNMPWTETGAVVTLFFTPTNENSSTLIKPNR